MTSIDLPEQSVKDSTAGSALVLTYLTRLSKRGCGCRSLGFQNSVGDRAFSYQAPVLWNKFPLWTLEADTESTFTTRLKTFLFDKPYNQGGTELPSDMLL